MLLSLSRLFMDLRVLNQTCSKTSPALCSNSCFPKREMLRAVINGRKVMVDSGASILSAINKSGQRIPTLCFNGRFKPKASCRLCLVQTSKSSKLVPACRDVIDQDGMEITTDSPEILKYRKSELEMLLSRHPNECMTCEVNGSCKLQDVVHDLDVHAKWPKNVRDGTISHHEDPVHHVKDFTSPCISRDLRKCIECGLCVEACGRSQGQDINAIGFADRGSHMLPVTVFDKPLKETDCIDCGQCDISFFVILGTNVCPVGALTEHADWHRVLKELDSKRKTLIVQTAPATRVAISEEFGLEPG